MTVSTAPGPAEGPSVVAKALSDLGQAARYRFALLPGQPSAALPLAIYYLKPAALSTATPLAACFLVGWRYLVAVRGNRLIVDLKTSAESQPQFYALRDAEFARQFTEACATAESVAKPDVAYDSRIIKIPSLHLDAIWLAAAGGDIFVPIHVRDAGNPGPIDLIDVARQQLNSRVAAAARSAADRKDLGG